MRRRSHGITILLVALIMLAAAPVVARPKALSLKQMKQTVERHFSSQPDYVRGDLIARGDVQAVLEKLKQEGWSVPAGAQLVAAALPEAHPLVAELRSKPGKKFMRKVSNDRLIYDRLERISMESGGRQLIHDLVRLPDGGRYVRQKRPRAVPGMRDLLPKNRSGKTREVKDYDKPTGHIYTAADLLERLGEQFQRSPTA